MMIDARRNSAGFTLVEMMVSVLVLGVLMIAMGGLFVLFQKSAAQTNEYTEVQQNARIALDFVTDHLRQAGSQTDYFRGQQPIVHAGPYQVAINADIDNQQTIDGMGPLTAIRRSFSPNRVPASGTIIYSPTTDYQSNAETIVLTLDSNGDGVISASDRGDDPEESGRNTNLFILKKVVYGYDGAGSNEVRESNLALLRGPNMAPTWTVPQPLFQYFYDHDNNPSTADRLWGDGNLNGVLETGEITVLTVMPQNLLSSIRKIKTTAAGESDVYNTKYETNGGYLGVTMTSEVYVRNATRTSSNIYGKVYHDIDSDGIPDQDETGIPRVEIRLTGQSRSVLTDNFGMFYFPLPAGTYSLTEVDPPGYTSTTANMVSVTLAAGQTSIINFGDRSTTPTGKIKGTVYEDADADGIKDAGETGLNGVLVSLDNGAQVLTSQHRILFVHRPARHLYGRRNGSDRLQLDHRELGRRDGRGGDRYGDGELRRLRGSRLRNPSGIRLYRRERGRVPRGHGGRRPQRRHHGFQRRFRRDQFERALQVHPGAGNLFRNGNGSGWLHVHDGEYLHRHRYRRRYARDPQLRRYPRGSPGLRRDPHLPHRPRSFRGRDRSQRGYQGRYRYSSRNGPRGNDREHAHFP